MVQIILFMHATANWYFSYWYCVSIYWFSIVSYSLCIIVYTFPFVLWYVTFVIIIIKIYILVYKYMYLYLNNKSMFVYMYMSLYANKYGIYNKFNQWDCIPAVYGTSVQTGHGPPGKWRTSVCGGSVLAEVSCRSLLQGCTMWPVASNTCYWTSERM